MKKVELYKFIVFIWFFIFSVLFSSDAPSESKNNNEIETIFGPLKLQNELLKTYNLQYMQRLKNVDRSGSIAYWNGVPKISRADHCLEMLWLVQNFGGDLQEQIAALIFDISESVFSQVTDVVFGIANYQDTIHEWFLQQTGITEIINGHDWTVKDITPKNPKFKRLHQEFPNMCAENIAYVLHTALALKMVKKDEISFIISKLHYEDDKWCFTALKAARKFANLSLALAKGFWGAADHLVVYHITGRMLKRAMLLDRITEHDIHFGIDQQILDKLNACDDPEITRLIAKAKIPKTAYRILKNGEGTPDFVPKAKFRGIDPWIFYKHSKKFKRLSESQSIPDKKFAKEFMRAKKSCEKGYKIQLNID